jgi:uncharacterized protein YndB with AHSA1/START domain
MLTAPERTCLLIADISGYTSYLAGVELDHAQDILADLVSTVVTALRPTFRLAKLEGDAAFMAGPAEQLDGSVLLDTIERCYFGFRRRRRDVRQATSCECDACVRIPNLDLKFVVHLGDVVRQDFLGHEELVGAPVIVIHRLLKNDVVAATGIEAYALFSQSIVDAMGLEPEALGMRPHVESYEHIGEVATWVEDLERRWQEEDARARVFVRPEDATVATTYEVGAPPAVAWEFLTTPGRRVEWGAGITDVIQEAPGNRRSVGTTNHCMHGADAIVEEVLDWRPFDYFTVRSSMETPEGPARILNTTEIEPTPTGSRISLRFGQPESAEDAARLEPLKPMFEGMMAASSAALKALLASEVAARVEAAPPEPDVPAPKPDGLFSEMAPISYVG